MNEIKSDTKITIGLAVSVGASVGSVAIGLLVFLNSMSSNMVTKEYLSQSITPLVKDSIEQQVELRVRQDWMQETTATSTSMLNIQRNILVRVERLEEHHMQDQYRAKE